MKKEILDDFDEIWKHVAKEIACFRVILNNEDISDYDALKTLSYRMGELKKKIDESL